MLVHELVEQQVPFHGLRSIWRSPTGASSICLLAKLYVKVCVIHSTAVPAAQTA